MDDIFFRRGDLYMQVMHDPQRGDHGFGFRTVSENVTANGKARVFNLNKNIEYRFLRRGVDERSKVYALIQGNVTGETDFHPKALLKHAGRSNLVKNKTQAIPVVVLQY